MKVKHLMIPNPDPTKRLIFDLISSGRLLKEDVPDELYKEYQIYRASQLLEHAAICLGSDNRYSVKIPDTSRKDGRRTIKGNTLEDLYVNVSNTFERLQNPRPAESANTLNELYPLWGNYCCQHHVCEETMTRYDSDYRKYFKDSAIANTPLNELDAFALEEHMTKIISENHLKSQAYRNVKSLLKKLLDYACKCNIINDNPADHMYVNTRVLLKPSRKPDNQQRVFTDEEVKRFITQALYDFRNPSPRRVYKLIPLLSAFSLLSGTRPGEAVGLMHIDIEPCDIHIQRMVGKDSHEIKEQTKTAAGDRRVHLTPKAKEILEMVNAYKTENGIPLDGFIFSEYERPVSMKAVEKNFKVVCKKIGAFPKPPKAARSNYISTLLEHDVNINTVREQAGQADERTTQYYYGFDRHTPAEIRQQIDNALKMDLPDN